MKEIQTSKAARAMAAHMNHITRHERRRGLLIKLPQDHWRRDVQLLDYITAELEQIEDDALESRITESSSSSMQKKFKNFEFAMTPIVADVALESVGTEDVDTSHRVFECCQEYPVRLPRSFSECLSSNVSLPVLHSDMLALENGEEVALSTK